MKLASVGRMELAALIALSHERGSWFVLGAFHPEQEAALLADELHTTLGAPVRVVALAQAADIVSASLASATQPLVVVANAAVTASLELDAWRTSLTRAACAALVLPSDALSMFSTRHPHFVSWIGGEVHSVDDDRFLDSAARTARLEALRAAHGMSDDEVVTKFAEGKVAPNPDIAEWLVLVGRGDLLVREKP